MVYEKKNFVLYFPIQNHQTYFVSIPRMTKRKEQNPSQGKNRRLKKQKTMRVEGGNVGQEVEPGDDVIRGRLMDNTRQQYGEKIQKFCAFLLTHHPEYIKDDKILLPLPVNVVKMFLQHTSIKRDKHGVPRQPQTFNTFSHINGYSSAIKYLYKENKVSVSFELDEMMEGIKCFFYFKSNCCRFCKRIQAKSRAIERNGGDEIDRRQTTNV